MKHVRIVPALFLVFALCYADSKAQTADPQESPKLTLEDIHNSRKFSPAFFRGGRWTDDGPVVTSIDQKATTGTDIISYNLETDNREVVLDGSKLFAEDVGRVIEIEGYDFGPDGKLALLYTDSERVWRQNTKGFYYIYDTESHALRPLSDRSKGFQMFAKLSPDASSIGFVRDRNLFVVDLATGEEKQLTFDGSEGAIINGTFDWVYEEEFGLRDGWSWNPDSRSMAFFKLDESKTRDFAMTDLRDLYPEYVSFRYPKAGEDNSEVQVGVVDITSGEIKFIDTDTWNTGGDTHEYIARMGWTPEVDGESDVWMMRLDRDQNDLDLLFADNSSMTTVIQESEPTWIDVESQKLTFLDDGKHFVWMSEASGYNHLYLYRTNGELVTPITSGNWDVQSFHGIDEETGTAYFTAAIDSPLERNLYSIQVSLSGTEQEMTASPVQITRGDGTHNVNMSSDLRYYIGTYSEAMMPPVTGLYSRDGQLIKTLESNSQLMETLAAYTVPEPEFVQVPGADGTPLNAYLMKPSNFDNSKSYPVLMYVYGGPGSQTVRNSWGGSRVLWHAYLAEELGIIVASVDNRGTGGRGKAFKSGTYKRLGQLEAEDQIAAAKYLGSLDYVDADRIGIWGWSYGGYMTLLSLLYGDGPETFKVGLSVAPVTDWRLYDTIYTERYMSTPQRNAEGYDVGAPQTYADRLQPHQKLLIVHGDFDDNVHFQNAVQMIDALQRENKQFDFMMYPGKNHGIFGGSTRLNVFTKLTDYLKANL
ncbi:MAG: S9 family peptidase [Rhodothermales bacterium]|nr:S9 family peptidase [Rhodothermales bacterium]